ADDRELRPAEEKRRQPAPRVANENVDAASLGERAGDLGERQRAAERHDAAGDPDAEERQRSWQPLRDAGRGSEDSRADRDADDDGNRAPQPELAGQGGGR